MNTLIKPNEGSENHGKKQGQSLRLEMAVENQSNENQSNYLSDTFHSIKYGFFHGKSYYG
jgi:hypothetical protein